MIGVVDYKVGNLASVLNAFAKLGIEARLVTTAKEIAKSDKLLLPGVGAFGDAMGHLEQYELTQSIKEYAKSGKYLLGICLGMQLLFKKSEEFGESGGLGILDGEVRYFDKSKTKLLKIPHMGWNQIQLKESLLFDGLNKEPYLYFVHSLHVVCDDDLVLGTTNYGYGFTSIVGKDNVFGIQPHPEKSHENGLKILKNFSNLK